MTSSSSLSISRCTPSGPMDLCMSSLLTLPPPWSCSTNIFLVPACPPDFWGLWLLKTRFASKDWGKERIQDLSFFDVMCHQVPCLIQQWAKVFPRFLSPLTYLQKSSCSRLALAFLTAPLHVQTAFLCSSQVTCHCFHLLYTPFLCLSLVRSSLLIHAGFLAILPEILLIGRTTTLEEVTSFLAPSCPPRPPFFLIRASWQTEIPHWLWEPNPSLFYTCSHSTFLHCREDPVDYSCSYFISWRLRSGNH